MDANKLISAKAAVINYDLGEQMLINIIRSGKVTIYDKNRNVVTLDQHNHSFAERTYDYTPVDIQGYFDAFDFGSSPIEEVKQDIIKYENKKVEDAAIEIEFDIIVNNYRFYKSEFDKAYKEIFPNNIETNRPEEYCETVNRPTIIAMWKAVVDQYPPKRDNDALPMRMKLLLDYLGGTPYSELEKNKSSINISDALKKARC